jgi:hypothetical protein
MLGAHPWQLMERPMAECFDASKSLAAFEPDSTLVVVIEMSQTKWLVAAMVPGVARQPLKKIDADPRCCSSCVVVGAVKRRKLENP